MFSLFSGKPVASRSDFDLASLDLPLPAPSPDLVRDYWRAAGRDFGSRALPKARSPLMIAVSWFLHLTRILDRHRFMHRYTTVLFRRIYHPFPLGDPQTRDLLAQLIVGVHEHQHCHQFDRDGYLPYALRYLLSSRQRALLEAEAYACNLELQMLFTNQHSDPQQTAAILADYNCSPDDIQAAADVLQRTADDLQDGIIKSQATLHFLHWYQQHQLDTRSPTH